MLLYYNYYIIIKLENVIVTFIVFKSSVDVFSYEKNI